MKRLIYMLKSDEKNRLLCLIYQTDLLKWERIHPLPLDRMRDLLRPAMQKVFREGDAAIIRALIQAERRGSEPPVAVLEGDWGFELIRKIVDSRRAFFLNGNHLRVHWGKKRKASPRWEKQKDGLWRPHYTSKDDLISGYLATSPPLYYSYGEEKDFLGLVVDGWPQKLGEEWLKSAALPQEKVTQHRLRLRKKHPRVKIPKLPQQKEAVRSVSPTPILTLESTSAQRKNRASGLRSDPHKMLQVRLSFRYGTKEIEDSDTDESIFSQEGNELIVSPRQREFEKRAIETLRELGFQKEQPDEEFLLSLTSPHYFLSPEAPQGWHKLVSETFPRLETEGWSIRSPRGLEIISSQKEH